MRNYEKEIVFAFYFKNYENILRLLNYVRKYGFKPLLVVGTSDFLADEFDFQNNEQELKNGVFINFEDQANSMIISHNETKELYSLRFFFRHFDNCVDVFKRFLSGIPKIEYAYLASQYDIAWENETSLKVYEANNRSIKGRKITRDIFGRKCVNIEYNYGRTILKDGILYNAAYITWFRPGLMDKKIIDALKQANFLQIDELTNGVMEIKLLPDLIGRYENFRKKQKQFLKLMRLL